MERPPYMASRSSYLVSRGCLLVRTSYDSYLWRKENFTWPPTPRAMAGRLGKNDVSLTSGSYDYGYCQYDDSNFALCLDGLHNAYGVRSIQIWRMSYGDSARVALTMEHPNVMLSYKELPPPVCMCLFYFGIKCYLMIQFTQGQTCLVGIWVS